MADKACEFCDIISGKIPSDVVYRNADVIAFLDNRPLFPGHVLLCPVQHYQTLTDLPESQSAPLMRMTQLLAAAVETALNAEGSFVAINNRISQSVPHLHIHVVPRRKRDGLKGFFWPRHSYDDAKARETVRKALEREIQKSLGSEPSH